MVAGACELRHDGKVRISICISCMLKVSFTFWSFRLLPISASAGAERLIEHWSVSFSYAGTHNFIHPQLCAGSPYTRTHVIPADCHAFSLSQQSFAIWLSRARGVLASLWCSCSGCRLQMLHLLLPARIPVLPFALLVFISSSWRQLSWTGPKRNIWQMASKPKSD